MRYEYPSLRQGLEGAWCPSLGSVSPVIIDRSGKGRNGAIVTPSYDANLPGNTVVGNAMTASIPSGTIGTTATWSVWLRIFGASGQGPFQITQASTLELYVFSDSNSYLATFLTSGNRRIINSSIIRNPTQLNHLAITTDGTTTATYANGVLWNSIAAQSFVMRTQILIGNCQRTADATPLYPLQGSWDDARLYNRALTLAEIRLLASRRGIGLTPLPDRGGGLPRKMSVNVGGTWRSADAYVNVGGTWKLAQASTNVAGTWR